MVDNRTYEILHPRSSAIQLEHGEATDPLDPFPAKVFHNAELDLLALRLLPANVYGFYFQEKQWSE